jgi:outer membrane protein OmpA-like peptidoglycan-associated protein
MAILMRALVSMGMVMVGWSANARTGNHDPVRHGIGWINRQFLDVPETELSSSTTQDLGGRGYSRPSAEIIWIQPRQVDPPPRSSDPEAVEQRIHFEFGKGIAYAAGPQNHYRLFCLAKAATRIELDGRTDDIGSQAFNDRLARQRAEHVRDWLLREGVSAPHRGVSRGSVCCYGQRQDRSARRQQSARGGSFGASRLGTGCGWQQQGSAMK